MGAWVYQRRRREVFGEIRGWLLWHGRDTHPHKRGGVEHLINGEGTMSYFPVNGGSLVTMHVKKGDTFVFPQGSAHWWVNYSPTEQLATVGGFTAPFPDAAPLADFLDESKKVNNLLTDAVLGENYRSALELQEMNGAGTLFPLLSTRSPSTCGGNTPCQRCT